MSLSTSASTSASTSSPTRLRAAFSLATRHASAPAGAYIDEAGELHHFPLGSAPPQRRRRSASSERPAWERGHAYTYSSARPSSEELSSRAHSAFYHAAYTHDGSPWSASSASSDDRPLQHAFRPTFRATVDEDGVPQTPQTPAWARRWSTRKLQKSRVLEEWDEPQDCFEALPLPTPFAAALAEPLYPVVEPEPVKDDDVPSCSYLFRRKYVAISMRIRFSLHHAKRRFKRKVSAPSGT